MAAFARSVEVQRTLGVPDCRVLERDELRTVVPDLRTRRPGRRPVRPERRVHRRPRLLRRAGGRGQRPRRPRPAGHRARRLRSAPRRSEPAPDEPRRPRVRRRGQRRGRLGRPGRRPPRRAGHDPAAAAPGADRAPAPRRSAYVMPSVMDYVPSSGGFGAYFRDDGPGRLVAGLHTEEVIHDIVDPDAVAARHRQRVRRARGRTPRPSPASPRGHASRRRVGRHLPDAAGRPAGGRPARRTGVGGHRSRAPAARGSSRRPRSGASPRTGSSTGTSTVDPGRCRAQAAGRERTAADAAARGRRSIGDHRASRPP